MSLTLYLVTALAVGLVIMLRRIASGRRWIGVSPPGPPLHPIFENLPTMRQLDKVPYRAFNSLTAEYGSIARLILLAKKQIVVGGYEEIKEIANNDKFDSRPSSSQSTLINMLIEGSGRPQGIIFNSGLAWKEMRKFTLKSLRDLGYGKTASEEAIIEECAHLTQSLANAAGGKIYLGKLLNCAALNVVWCLVASQRFEYDDARMSELLNHLESFMLLGRHVLGKPLGIFPFLRFVPPYRAIFQNVKDRMGKLNAYFRQTIQEHKEKFDPDNPQDFIDLYLVRSAEEDADLYTESNLVALCFDLFAGGSETTSKSLLSAVGYLVHHPQVQDKVYNELRQIVEDKDRVPMQNNLNQNMITMQDKEQLHYTQATLSEVWRLGHIVPIPPPRSASEQTKVKGYDIPKDTRVFFNTYSVHMDKSYWKDPKDFRPERFLNSAGHFQPDERMMQFGYGRRKCLGETLARMENLLMFSNLFYKFRFSCEELPSMEPEPGLSNGPRPFEVFVEARG